MTPPDERDPRRGRTGAAEIITEGTGRRCNDTPGGCHVADATRAVLIFSAAINPTPLGVRPTGELNWQPDPPGDGERLEPVAIAQDRHLARRSVDAKFHRLRELRAVVRWWAGAA
jgi:hypothetical protein